MILFNFFSNAITLISRLGQRFCRPKWAQIEFFFFYLLIFFLDFHRSTFYFLEIEFHIFSFYFFWSYHVLIWFIRNYSLNFFPAFLFMRLSQYYVHYNKVCVLTRFDWVFYVFLIFIQFLPSSLNCFIIRVDSNQVFFFFFYCHFFLYIFLLLYCFNHII